MKLRNILVVMTLILSPTLAWSQSKIGGVDVFTVAELKAQSGVKGDGMIATAIATWRSAGRRFALKGTLEGKIKGDFYTFKDSTGTIAAEIDDFDDDIIVAPGVPVLVIGEADYEDGEVVLEINRIKFVAPQPAKP